MTSHQTSFAIQGMFCAKCAASIERALAGLDGVAAARVNYATERANVVYDAARVTTGALAQAVRGEGFDVPCERVVLYSNDLLYASSARAIQKALERAGGVVQSFASLAARQITIDVIPETTTRDNLTRALARWGIRTVEALSSDAWVEFVVRASVIAAMGIVLIWGAVNHGPVLSTASLLPSPILLGAVTALVLLGAGFPFFRRAFLASTQREFDGSVGIALIVFVALLCGAAWTLNANARVERIGLAWSGYLTATLLTVGWFAARGATAFVLPRLGARKHADAQHVAPQTQFGIISNDTRR